MKYAVRKRGRREWIMDKPGGRLDPWGPISGRAEYLTLKSARLAIRNTRSENFSVVVALPAKLWGIQDTHTKEYLSRDYSVPDGKNVRWVASLKDAFCDESRVVIDKIIARIAYDIPNVFNVWQWEEEYPDKPDDVEFGDAEAERNIAIEEKEIGAKRLMEVMAKAAGSVKFLADLYTEMEGRPGGDVTAAALQSWALSFK